MLCFTLFNIPLKVSYFFLSILAFLILLDRSGVLTVSLIAVAFHEIGHLFMMKFLNIQVESVDFNVATIRVNTVGFLTIKDNLCIALAGPLMNLILSLFLFFKIDTLEYFGISNLILFVFNMFPAKGLDGGDALYYLLNILKVKSPDKIYALVSLFSISALIISGGILFFFSKSNITLLLVGIYLLILSFRKI